VSAPGPQPGTPLLAYRWAATDSALHDQLALGDAGYGGWVEPGHAAVRYTNPTNGQDVLPTIRAEMHRVRRGTTTTPVREVGSSVYQVFDGTGTVQIEDHSWSVTRGDLFVVPSWASFSVTSQAGSDDSDSGALDLFRFSDAPIVEKLDLARCATGAAR
jgi:gentisate 1,2-dioxygenase